MAQRPAVGPVRHFIGRAWLRAFGWHVEGEVPDETKAVFIAAPHTSNWDLPFTLAVAWSMRTNVSWIGKESLFAPPLFGRFLKALGGVSVVRGKNANQVESIAQAIQREREGLYLVIAPGGTRTKPEHWKTGFYRIAERADVPILLGFLDYKGKRGGIGPVLRPSGDLVRDMDRIRAFYADKIGKHEERMGNIRLREEGEGGERGRE